MAEKTEEEKEEQKRKMKEGRDRKLQENKDARTKLLRDTEADIRKSNTDANDEKIKKLVEKAIKAVDADTKITNAFNSLVSAILDKDKLKSKGTTGEISATKALAIVRKSLA